MSGLKWGGNMPEGDGTVESLKRRLPKRPGIRDIESKNWTWEFQPILKFHFDPVAISFKLKLPAESTLILPDKSTLIGPTILTKGTITKPPLGVMPKSIWVDNRKRDLARAIFEYVDQNPNQPLLLEWLDELKELVRK